MRMLIGIITRIIFWLTAIYFVGTMAVGLFLEGNIIYAILAIAFFPITYFIFPILAGQWWLLLISLASYAISTIYGKMESVE